MKKSESVFFLSLLLVLSWVPSSLADEYMTSFQGYLGVGDNLTFGNYTLTVVDVLNANTPSERILFKIRDNSAFEEKEFALKEGESYDYKDVRVELIYTTIETVPRAVIRIYSKPVTVYYGKAYERNVFRYGPISFTIVEIGNESILARYLKGDEIDYRRFEVGNYFWHELQIGVENISKGSVTIKINAPKYVRFAIVRGAEISIENINFGEVEIGSPFTLNLTLKNIGDKEARFISVYLYSKEIINVETKEEKTLLPTVSLPQFSSSLPFAAYKGSPIKYIETLVPGKTAKLSFSLISSKNLKEDVYPLYIRVDYKDEEGAEKSKEIQVGVPVVDKIRPKIIIEEFDVIPSTVSPDSNFTIRIKLKNVGNSMAKHVKLDLLIEKPKEEQTSGFTPYGQPAVPETPKIYPIGKQSSLYFNEINTTAEGELYFRIEDVPRGIYPLYAVLNYEDENGIKYTEKATFGIEVAAYPILTTYIGNVWVSGGKYNFEVYVVNDGKDAARSVVLEVTSKDLELFPVGQRYVGSIGGRDYDSVTYQILNHTLAKVEYKVHANIYYKDESGEERVVEKDLTIRIPEKLVQERKMPLWEYAIGGALILVLILLWRRKSD
ncbi:MAG: hypothetical protein J7K57_06650 [Palaeococcus sp.]|uniref:COG1361 S-layer family protein n=1 Tax=Palaeococcus sp. (in: euryarchaeotes) TaxID=2820298 RepID=UPI0025E7BDE9|nr:hypothetical protein [Palaeococcus sp. (in: euryarchaeotes)]MCD6559535.1 hypothetical protein [Palaeococcus sp. (in: euryarchaeotes)]